MQNRKIDTSLQEKWIDENAHKPFPHGEAVSWFDLGCLTQVEYDTKKVSLGFAVQEKEYTLYLSFPEIGGIRLCSDATGFHSSGQNKKIQCTEREDGIRITAGGETEALLCTDTECWSIRIYRGERLVNTVVGKQLLLGMDKNGNISKIKLVGHISEDEIFTGLGERFDRVVRNGTHSLLWNLDCLFQMQGKADSERIYSYTNIPLLHSSNGYTLFINSSYAIDADIGKTDSKEYFFECFGPTFDVYCWVGDFDDRLEAYAKLTGYSILPPKWAFSYWAGNSAIYFANANGGNHMQTLRDMMEGYANIGIPIKAMFVEGVIHRDEKVYEYLNKTDTRVIAWHDSGYSVKYNSDEMMGDNSPHLRPYFADGHEELKQKYCDFTHPNAMAAMDQMHGKYIQLGIKGAMIDFADAVPYNSVTYDGRTGDEMHNLYAYLYQKHFKELYEKYNGEDYILFARAGFPGTQSFMAKFLGDQPCTFEGMRISLTAAMNLSLSGFSLWGSDIGGLGIWRKHIPDEDCYRRWIQWAAFNPIMRSHGHTTRAPWDFSADAVRDFQKYYWLRENLMDTIYSSVIESSRSAAVMTEPMQLAFPKDKAVALTEDEYMFCRDILVAPVLKEKALARKVILPAGAWTDFWTGVKVEGGSFFQARASEGTIPLYLRQGTLLKIKLPESLKLCENMENGSCDGLLISPAGSRREVMFNRNETDVEKYVSEFVNGKTVITKSAEAAVKAVIAKGISAVTVTVDGVLLQKADGISVREDPCYTVDAIRNTTTIRLADAWKKLEIEDSGKTVKNLALQKFLYSEIDSSGSFHRTVADGWSFNYWTVPRSNAKFTLDLEEIKEITEIQMTWGIDYADSYTVELSCDGESWPTAIKVTDGMGDEEILSLPEKTKARYIRFSNFGFAQRTPAVLGDIRVYGTELEEK